MTNSIHDTLKDNFTQQLCEFELLQSMYPKTGEIVLTDKNIINDINIFLQNKTDFTPGHLDFTLNLHVSNLKLEVCINLPSLYPEEEPDIYVRCNQLNRHQETYLNSELCNYIKNNHTGEVCLYNIVSWLQDNLDMFNVKTEIVNNVDENQLTESSKKFVRLWVYSHHIYNKKKRDEIVKRAKELKLTGICLPGKPGIICLEGSDNDCNAWWRDIKSMNWKKIVIRKSQIFEHSEQIEQQKFSNFEEILFPNSSTRMSRFSKFIDKCGLSKEFSDMLGLSNDDL